MPRLPTPARRGLIVDQKPRSPCQPLTTPHSLYRVHRGALHSLSTASSLSHSLAYTSFPYLLPPHRAFRLALACRARPSAPPPARSYPVEKNLHVPPHTFSNDTAHAQWASATSTTYAARRHCHYVPESLYLSMKTPPSLSIHVLFC